MTIQEILRQFRNIAVVGLSSDPTKTSFGVASYLASQGYNIIPVNPNEDKVLERPCYPNLKAIPEKVDVVDIFRRADAVMPIIEEAIGIGAKVVWMQEGIINESAASKAREAGLQVVMNRCMAKEHRLLKDS